MRGPLPAGVERTAEDADPAGCVLDDGKHADLCAVQKVSSKEVAGHDAFGLGPQQARPVGGLRRGAGSIPAFLSPRQHWPPSGHLT